MFTGVAGEADEIEATVLREAADVVEPGLAGDALAAPRLGLAAGALVKVGEVEDAEPVDRKALRDVVAMSRAGACSGGYTRSGDGCNKECEVVFSKTELNEVEEIAAKNISSDFTRAEPYFEIKFSKI